MKFNLKWVRGPKIASLVNAFSVVHMSTGIFLSVGMGKLRTRVGSQVVYKDNELMWIGTSSQYCY